MDRQQKLMAAAAYDRCLDDRAARHGTTFALVDLGADRGKSLQRMILCGVAPSEAPPEPLRLALDVAVDVMRSMWVALVREEDAALTAQINRIHSALQHETLMTEIAWEKKLAPARDIADWLEESTTSYHRAVSRFPPGGPGVVIPEPSRASEPYPHALRAAVDTLRTVLASFDDERAVARDHVTARELTSRRVKLDTACYAAIGAWRLGEADSARVAARILTHIDTACGRDSGTFTPASGIAAVQIAATPKSNEAARA